nr:MAG: hypothetical protein GM42_1420 [actinobacterium acMicro-1]
MTSADLPLSEPEARGFVMSLSFGVMMAGSLSAVSDNETSKWQPTHLLL